MISAMKKFVLATSALALGLYAPVGAEETSNAVRPGPALWKIADDDTTIYLFGTVHILPKETAWFDGRVEAAFTASDELVTEVDMLAAGGLQQEAPAQALLPAGQTLRGLMNQEDRAEYEAALIALGLPPGALDRFDPWFAAINLGMIPAVRKGYHPNHGVDMALTQMAGTKRRSGLETIEFQLDMFDSTPMELQLFYLDRTVEQLPEAGETIDAMIIDWLAGDTVGLAAIMNAAFVDPEAYEWLITRRNRKWADWIDARLDEPGTVFVAVGAGHLAGPGSVQEQLAEHGIETLRLQ